MKIKITIRYTTTITVIRIKTRPDEYSMKFIEARTLHKEFLIKKIHVKEIKFLSGEMPIFN